MSEHTPGPWRFRAIGETRGVIEGPDADCPIATMARWFPPHDPEEQRANAAHIVRCVNSHDELLEALEAVISGPSKLNARLRFIVKQAIALAKATT